MERDWALWGQCVAAIMWCFRRTRSHGRDDEGFWKGANYDMGSCLAMDCI